MHVLGQINSGMVKNFTNSCNWGPHCPSFVWTLFAEVNSTEVLPLIMEKAN